METYTFRSVQNNSDSLGMALYHKLRTTQKALEAIRTNTSGDGRDVLIGRNVFIQVAGVYLYSDKPFWLRQAVVNRGEVMGRWGGGIPACVPCEIPPIIRELLPTLEQDHETRTLARINRRQAGLFDEYGESKSDSAYYPQQ